MTRLSCESLPLLPAFKPAAVSLPSQGMPPDAVFEDVCDDDDPKENIDEEWDIVCALPVTGRAVVNASSRPIVAPRAKDARRATVMVCKYFKAGPPLCPGSRNVNRFLIIVVGRRCNIC